jgi:cold-inducible RNA-binding protein
MGNKLYVGNLSYDTTEASLQAHFEQAGDVEDVAIIRDRETGRSRGFAFVEMADDSQAQAAVEQLDGSSLDGRPLKVNEAKPRPDSRGGGGGGGGGGGRGGGGRSGGGGGGGYRDRGGYR